MKRANVLVLTLMVLVTISLYILWPSGAQRVEKSESHVVTRQTNNATTETKTGGPVEVKHGFSFEVSKDSKDAPKLEALQARQQQR